MMSPVAQPSAQMGNVPVQAPPTGNEMMPVSNMNNPQAQQKYQMGKFFYFNIVKCGRFLFDIENIA